VSEFILPREHRRRKRAIYARANKALGDLNEALRDMREFVGDIKPLYTDLQDDAGAREIDIFSLIQRRLKTLDISNNDIRVHDLLSMFNNTNEEL
jgi:uncharacterized ferritin-like protein (DUF455 family)